jgi:hypothetical protein
VLKLFNGRVLVNLINYGYLNHVDKEYIDLDLLINIHYFLLSKNKMLIMVDNFKFVKMIILHVNGEFKGLNLDYMRNDAN